MNTCMYTYMHTHIYITWPDTSIKKYLIQYLAN